MPLGVQCTQNRKGYFEITYAIEFIETPIFTRQIKAIATDDELKELQIELISSPDKGVLIKNTGGLRKIRMPNNSKGKSSSIRVR